jgi:AcrR family transcriptional regulator
MRLFDMRSIRVYTKIVLNAEAVIDAGLSLVSTDGFAALGIRALSARLGVTPKALYRHVGGAEQLEHEVTRAIIQAIPLISSALDWPVACREWAPSARAVLVKYPGAAQYLLTRCFELTPMLVQVEALLSAALRSGRRGFDAVAAANAVLMYVLMRVEAETAVRRAGSVKRRLRDVRANPRAFPALHEHVAHYEIARFDEHFTYGLEVLLAGQGAKPRKGGRDARP